MTTKAFDLACLIPPAAPVLTDLLVVKTTSPQLVTDWQPATTGGAYTPYATTTNQIMMSNPTASFPWAPVTVPTDGSTYGLGNNAVTPVVPMSGGVTMTGLVVLSGAPNVANGAATKAYVDATAAAATGLIIDVGVY